MSDQADIGAEIAGREAWLEWRRTGITATDTAGILGLSPWSSPYAVWADKAGLLPATDVTDAMEFGTRAEQMIGQWFTDKTGMYVAGEQVWGTHPTNRWMLATVDGFVVDAPSSATDQTVPDIDKAFAGFEVKTTTDTADEWDQQIPDHIMCQVQWQMAVTGMPRTYLATLHLGFRVEFRVRIIERDEDDIDALLATCAAFWIDHCLTGVPPETDGSDATTRALRGAFPGDEELDAITADAELRIECIRVNALKTRIKESEASLTEAENNIRAHLGDATALVDGIDGKGKPIVLATWKPGSRTSLDGTALRAAEPVLAAKYTKTSHTRTLLVKSHKGK